MVYWVMLWTDADDDDNVDTELSMYTDWYLFVWVIRYYCLARYGREPTVAWIRDGDPIYAANLCERYYTDTCAK